MAHSGQPASPHTPRVRDSDLRLLQEIRNLQPAYVPTLVRTLNEQADARVRKMPAVVRILHLIRALVRLEEQGLLKHLPEPIADKNNRLEGVTPTLVQKQQRVFYSLTNEGETVVRRHLH